MNMTWFFFRHSNFYVYYKNVRKIFKKLSKNLEIVRVILKENILNFDNNICMLLKRVRCSMHTLFYFCKAFFSIKRSKKQYSNNTFSLWKENLFILCILFPINIKIIK